MLDAPDDASHFQIKRVLLAFRLDGSTADEHSGANGVVVLLLFESGTETVHTGIAVEEKTAGVVGDGVPGADENRGRRQLGKKFPHMLFMAGVKTNLTPCLRRKVMGRICVATSRRNFL